MAITNYLQMETIIGNSENPRYKRALELEYWMFGEISGGLYYDPDPQKVKPQGSEGQLSFTMYTGGSTPLLFNAYTSGQVLKEAILTVEDVTEYYDGGHEPKTAIKKLAIFKFSTLKIISLDTMQSNSGFRANASLEYKKFQKIIP